VESTIIPLHKKESTWKCDNYRTICIIPHAEKIMLEILMPAEQTAFVAGRRTRKQILNMRLIIKKALEFNKPVLLCFIDYTKTFDCVR